MPSSRASVSVVSVDDGVALAASDQPAVQREREGERDHEANGEAPPVSRDRRSASFGPQRTLNVAWPSS
jgi:hypothetical protein